MKFLLNNPFIYNSFNCLLRTATFRKFYCQRFIKPEQNNSILDIGCGTATILDYLPATCTYVGFDASQYYID